jgi:hypothetical protein
MLLFADDQAIIADREDNLQRAAHKLNQIITELTVAGFFKFSSGYVLFLPFGYYFV